jgi:hypothetical protein
MTDDNESRGRDSPFPRSPVPAKHRGSTSNFCIFKENKVIFPASGLQHPLAHFAGEQNRIRIFWFYPFGNPASREAAIAVVRLAFVHFSFKVLNHVDFIFSGRRSGFSSETR